MKHVAGLMYLGSLYTGALWIKYQQPCSWGLGASFLVLDLHWLFWLQHFIGHRKDTCELTVFIFVCGTAGRDRRVTSDSLNQRPRDNEIELRLVEQFD